MEATAIEVEIVTIIIITTAMLDQLGLAINDHEVVVHQHVSHGLIMILNVLELTVLIQRM